MTHAVNLFQTQNEQMINARDLHLFLESGQKFADWIKNLLSHYQEGIDFIKKKTPNNHQNGRPLIEYFITKPVALECIQLDLQSSYDKKLEAVKKFNLEEGQFFRVKREIEFIETMQKILEPFGYECFQEYAILNYRVDFYIKDLNVVIEYDELTHNYKEKSDHDRQEKITQAINCKFIRVSADKSHLWNCGYVLKNLFL